MIVDGHVTLGQNRDVGLELDELLAQLDRLAIAGAIVAPAERCLAVDNSAGNAQLAEAARTAEGRLGWYACANPWYGERALDILEEASGAGACALRIDPVLQGFDLLDGIVHPLIEFAVSRGWPVYCRTGTPVYALPLQLAELACDFPAGRFIMGHNGATDFWLDAVPALHRASNLYADTAYAFPDLGLEGLIRDPRVGPERIVFTSDAPFAQASLELDRIRDLDVDGAGRALKRILSENLLEIVGWSPPHP
jgi:predicted TIM-barrel fold metal-dependent hydrolase